MKYWNAKTYAFQKIKEKYGADTSADLATLKFNLSQKQRLRLQKECRLYHFRRQ